jgi:hypothetical protein
VNDDEGDESRRAILERRARFVRLAIVGVTAAATATACACLTPLPVDTGTAPDAGTDAGTDGSTP